MADPSRPESQLREEGFAQRYVWQVSASAEYPDHTHPVKTAYIILEGEMMLTLGGAERTYRTSERRDVPAGAVHSAKMGPRGCRHIIGER